MRDEVVKAGLLGNGASKDTTVEVKVAIFGVRGDTNGVRGEGVRETGEGDENFGVDNLVVRIANGDSASGDNWISPSDGGVSGLNDDFRRDGNGTVREDVVEREVVDARGRAADR